MRRNQGKGKVQMLIFAGIALIWFFAGTPAVKSMAHGFFQGALLLPIYLASLVADGVQIYSSKANGWYNTGFVCGALFLIVQVHNLQQKIINNKNAQLVKALQDYKSLWNHASKLTAQLAANKKQAVQQKPVSAVAPAIKPAQYYGRR